MLLAFIIIVNHYIADFICQTTKMATRKSTSIKWLTLHVMVYTVAISPIAFYLNYKLYGIWWETDFHRIAGSLFLLANFILHWITDFCTSRMTGFLYKKHLELERLISVYGSRPLNSNLDFRKGFLGETWMHWFFCVIGLDQVIHYACLFFTYEWLINNMN